MARILVVDDEADMRMALGNVLSRMGHQVFEAGDGAAALEFAAKEGADLMLLDMRLPGMDGLQILRKLRETDQKTPVIMVTGYGSVESAVEVMQLGAAHYLSKPFSNQELLETVEKILSGGRVPEAAGIIGRRLARQVRGGLSPVPVGGTALAQRAEYPVAEAPSFRPASVAGALLLTVLTAAGAWYWHAHGRHAGRDYSIGTEHPTALLWKDGRLFGADWVTSSVYEYELRGGRLETVRSVRLPRTNITGIALSGDALFVADSWAKKIQRRKLDDQFTLAASYDSPGPNPSGLFFDGKYLWSSDAAADRIYRHDPGAGLPVLEIRRAPGKAPAALYKDDKFFWSVDSESRLIYRHRLDRDLTVLSVYSLPLLDQGPAPLSGFTLRGDEIWMGRDGSGTIRMRPLSAFEEKGRRD